MSDKLAVLTFISQQNQPVSMSDIKSAVSFSVAERTVRRWLVYAVKQGTIIAEGQKRQRVYICTQKGKGNKPFEFLQEKSEKQKGKILNQLRDNWTYNSVAMSGNSLSYKNTQQVLDKGLPIANKTIKDHQAVIGHASAIELIYRMLDRGVSKESIFELHRAVQSNIVFDNDKPCGAWKVESNGTRVVGINGKQFYLEYAHPSCVDTLMSKLIHYINEHNKFESYYDAIEAYAKIHIAIVHIHPFFGGNGQVARLISNIPMLKAGLPPIIIPIDMQEEYELLISQYESKAGQLTADTDLWHAPELFLDFERFCLLCYRKTKDLIGL